MNLVKKLRQSPQLLSDYDTIILDQINQGIVEVVDESARLPANGRVHYLPHHRVVRQDKSTSKLRIVYDASVRSSGPSLNSCLYTGPNFGQSIFDILLRFRAQRIALTGDIEKAFLMVSVKKKDRDSLRFLWLANLDDEPLRVITLRFTWVVFGVSSNPFLLNVTINHHMEQYRYLDQIFIDKFLSSLYVDDLISGSGDLGSTYELYVKAKLRLAAAGFKLRKFATNSKDLQQRTLQNESVNGGSSRQHTLREEDQSYAKSSLGVKNEDDSEISKVLGVQWNIADDTLQFDVRDIFSTMEELEPTRRSVTSATARLFDPLGAISPLTITFKMFCHELCKSKIGWDDKLTGHPLEKWKKMLSTMKGANVLSIPCYMIQDVPQPIHSTQLIRFCDASSEAYAAVVYIRIQARGHTDVQFVAAKTRVAPASGNVTIPRLELLSALLLSRLITSVRTALETELQLDDAVCYTDSRVSQYWIQGVDHEWRQFVENRVNAIRRSIPCHQWRHCSGRDNPADLPSRGVTLTTLTESSLWAHGPEWLCADDYLRKLTEDPTKAKVPDECRCEMKQ